MQANYTRAYWASCYVTHIVKIGASGSIFTTKGKVNLSSCMPARRTVASVILENGKCNRTVICNRKFCKISQDNKLSVQELCELWTRKFKTAKVSEPQTSAELIIAHVLGKKMIHEVPSQLTLECSSISTINELCQQRLKSIPVQYIIGEWDFHELVLKMRKPVFIPRPETEELADFVCDYINSRDLIRGRFLEIGCGSGAISLYILSRFKEMMGVAIDKHSHACDLTLENGNNLALSDRLNIHQIDIFQKDILSILQQYLPFDVIVSNPPYIPTSKLKDLDLEVKSYESRDALDGGVDGLDIVRQILLLAPQLLVKGGQIWLEVDLEEPDIIRTMVPNHTSVTYVKTLKDFTQRDRFCVLQVD